MNNTLIKDINLQFLLITKYRFLIDTDDACFSVVIDDIYFELIDIFDIKGNESPGTAAISYTYKCVNV